MYAVQTSHLPLKLNMAGVIPPIFASSIILFPTTLAQMGGPEGMRAGCRISSPSCQPASRSTSDVRGRDHLLLLLLHRDGLQRDGHSRQPEKVRVHLSRVSGRASRPPLHRPGHRRDLTIGGCAVHHGLVCLPCRVLIVGWNVPFYFGGTSLLIVVVVVMDFMAQVRNRT